MSSWSCDRNIPQRSTPFTCRVAVHESMRRASSWPSRRCFTFGLFWLYLQNVPAKNKCRFCTTVNIPVAASLASVSTHFFPTERWRCSRSAEGFVFARSKAVFQELTQEKIRRIGFRGSATLNGTPPPLFPGIHLFGVGNP